MPSLRDYFDDPRAMELFKSMSLLDQADVLQAVDPNLAREHLTNVHRVNQAQGVEAEAAIPGANLQGITSSIAAVPRVIGTVGSAVPLAGAISGGIGELAAQGIEKAGGMRESFNPVEIGVQAGLGAIPGGFVAKTFKPTTKLMTKAAGALEGAGVGVGATALSAVAQGRSPELSELGTGLALGGAMGGAMAKRQALPRPDYTEKAHKQLYAAIQPSASDTREFSEHLNAALPYIYANRKGHVNSITDMEQAARGTMRRLWNLHIEPVVVMNSNAPVDTATIAQSLRSRINRDTPKSVRKAIEEEAAKFDQPRTLGELNRILKETNAKTRGLQEASGKSARTLRTDPKTGWRFEQLNELRSALANEAGRITGQGDMYMKLRKDWGALSEVADEAGEAAKRWEHQKKIEGAGALPGVQRVMKSVKGGLGFGGAAAVRRGLTEAATEYMSNPDRQVKGAFKRLRFGQRMSDQFPDPIPLPERRALPAMGETGEPSLGDLQYRMPDDRAAAKHARQRREGSRLLTGQTRDDLANQPAPGEPPPMQPSEMELSPGVIPRSTKAARQSPIQIGPVPDVRIKGSQVFERRGSGRNPNLSPEVIQAARGQAMQGGIELSEREFVKNFLNNISPEHMAAIQGNDKLAEAIRWAENAYRTRRMR